jgi:hypothetical protein
MPVPLALSVPLMVKFWLVNAVAGAVALSVVGVLPEAAATFTTSEKKERIVSTPNKIDSTFTDIDILHSLL